jgi:hypothetical protein
MNYNPHPPIVVTAPSGTYYLLFKHLKGSTHRGHKNPFIICGSNYYYTSEQVIDTLIEAAHTAIPSDMLKGHTLASAAYIWVAEGDRTVPHVKPDDELVGIGTSIAFTQGVPTNLLRRSALSKALVSLSAEDRAYFHIVLSELEGRPLLPILRTALARRYGNSRRFLVDHLLKEQKYIAPLSAIGYYTL